MCIAIYKPEGLVLTPETINESWSSNPDGAGFMYHENGQLFIQKGLMTLDAFKEAYEPHKTKDAVLHFRIKTHGNKDADNTHPFLVDNNLGMVHNGVIANVDTSTDTTKSDTWHFTDFYLHRFRQDNPKFFLNPIYKDMIEKYIGYSKLIFMDGEGNVEIFNEKSGYWDAGCWFSNKSYQPYVAPKYTPPKTETKKPQNAWSNQSKPDNSWSHMQKGDTVKLTTNVNGVDPLRAFTPEEIPANSYVEILYFTQNNMVRIEEYLTGLQATVHLSFLEPTGNVFPLAGLEFTSGN